MDSFDLIVVGGGLAGYTAARKAAERGARVLLLEKDAIGGRSRVFHALCRYARFHKPHQATSGLELIQAARLAGEALGERWSQNLAEAGVSVLHGRGRLGGGGEVLVESDGSSQTVSADKIILATGSAAHAPATLPFDGRQILSCDDLSSLESMPERALLLGEERAGCDAALLFRTLGEGKVFLLSDKPRLLPEGPQELAESLEAGLKRLKIKMLLGKRVISIYRNGSEIDVTLDGGVKFTTDVIVQTGGRRGCTEDIGARERGLRLGQSGEILVDEALQTSEPGIYAAGSVLGRPCYESLTEEEGKIAALNALGLQKIFDAGRVPRIIHSAPDIASIGCAFETAHHQGYRAVEGRCHLNELDCGLLREGEGGWVSLVADKKTARVIGAQVVSPRAADLISMISLAIQKGLTVEALKGVACDSSSETSGIKDAARACSEALKKARLAP